MLVLLILWEWLVAITRIEKWILPKPSHIVQSLWESRALIAQHSVQTIYEALLGLAIAIVIGVAIAAIIDSSEWLRKAFYPLLIISQTVPIIAVAPLFFIWFGYGILPKVVVVTLVCFFPVAINVADGLRLVDRDTLRLMASMGAGRWQIFHMVKLPATLPFFFSGMRIAGTYSVMGAVIGEWLGASKGLGILMTRSSQSFLTDRVFATIVVITLLSLAIFALIEGAARLLMPWHYRQKPSP
ncbi:ABC transporter permease [Brevibacillus humidisoli]|uniref:ABC transporter permease n=1 Tax=Brevibacillus humidisoli TaxID=2895522 RepID=UPI001E3DA5DD|nr:ABC transporter permease [Brevibacillus humidisoli]UFJ43383.1 ABC transporter permease [Brevibacillus humidisoli]